MDLWPRETSMLQVSDNGALLWTSGTKTSPLAWTDTDTSWSPSWESRNRCLYVYGQEVSFYSCHLTVNLIVKCSVENWISFQFYSNIEYFYEYMYWHNIWNLLTLTPCRSQKRNRDTVILHWKTKFWIRLPKNWQRRNADLPGRESKKQFIPNQGPSKSTYQSLPPWDSDIQIYDLHVFDMQRIFYEWNVGAKILTNYDYFFRFVMAELLQTERTYVKDLEVCIKVGEKWHVALIVPFKTCF